MHEHGKLVRLATVVSISVALVLILLKLIAWFRSDAISVQATLIDSVLDAMASFVNFFVVRQALKPADEEHRFGHGKIEALAALLQSAFIAGSALWLMMAAARRFSEPVEVQETTFGVIVMVISTLFALGLVAFQKYVIRKTRSTAVQADAAHYVSDILVNLSVIGALLGSGLPAGRWLDPCLGLLISFYICFSAWNISKQSIDMLIDRELPNDQRHQIIKLIQSHPQAKGYHDLRTRSAGSQTFIQFHLELDPDLSLLQAHHISEEVLNSIQEHFPHAEIIIHEDIHPPAGKYPTGRKRPWEIREKA